MGHVACVVLVCVGLPGIESLVWTEADRAERVRSLLVHAANIDLRFLAPVVVKPADGLVIIARRAGPEILRPRGSDFPECRQVTRQSSERAGWIQAEILQGIR